MGLRETAESDLATTLEDVDAGFGFAFTLTDPAGNSVPLTGSYNDIAQVVDPNTGMVVSDRIITIVPRISSIYAAGLTELPRGIADSGSAPWIVTATDRYGSVYTFKIRQADPDHTLGIIVCFLEEIAA